MADHEPVTTTQPDGGATVYCACGETLRLTVTDGAPGKAAATAWIDHVRAADSDETDGEGA